MIGTDPGTATAPPALTIYYDGACPLCRVKIAHYRRQQGADALRFVDVAETTACGPGLSHAQALARFHVRDAEGRPLSGAAAFVGLWQHLPRWRRLGRVAAWPPVPALLELGYRAFLPLRPALSRRLRVSVEIPYICCLPLLVGDKHYPRSAGEACVEAPLVVLPGWEVALPPTLLAGYPLPSDRHAVGISVQFSKSAPYGPAIAQLRGHEVQAPTQQPEAR